MPDPDITGFAVISGSRIIVPVEISSIDASSAVPGIGTIGTILSGITAVVGTLQVGTVSVVADTSTIGTIQSGNITASIIGGNIPDVGTIGTILSAVTVSPIAIVSSIGTIQSGQVTASISGPVYLAASPTVLATVSATVLGAGGTLYGVVASEEGNSPGTLILTYSGSGRMEIIVPGNDSRNFTSPKGIVISGSLVASIIGNISATFLF